MKEKSVLAVILVLLCFCLPFGHGDERITKIRRSLRKRYGILRPYSRDPNTVRKPNTIYQHLNEVNDKEKTGHNRLLECIGYTPEQLSSPPSSFMSEDELIVVTEYHLWQRDWYHVRTITLDKAAQLDSHVEKKYPRKDFCRTAASIALQRAQEHKDLYLQYYQALGKNARQNLMKEIKFPDYVDSVDHEYAEHDAVLKVIAHLKTLFKRLLDRKKSLNLTLLRAPCTIRMLLAPTRMSPNEGFLSPICDLFPVEDFSLPPNKVPRRDIEFLNVAWLLNRYRSLWYQKRREDFSKFLRQRKKGVTPKLIQRVKKAIDITNMLFQRYQLLSNDYCELVEKYQPDTTAIPRINPLAPEFLDIARHISVHISENEGLKQIKRRGKRKGTALKSIRKIVSEGTLETAVQQHLGEPKVAQATKEPQSLEDLNSPNPLFWENCQPHSLIIDKDGERLLALHQAALQAFGLDGRIIDNEGLARLWTGEHFQPDGLLLDYEKQHEADAIESVEQGELLGLNENADQHEIETRKQLEDMIETYPIVYKRRKLSSQTDDDRMTPGVAPKGVVHGSTFDRSSERHGIPTAHEPNLPFY